MKILIANNKGVTNSSVTSYLQQNGYHVVTSNSYPETLKKIEECHPDLIIADLNLSESTFKLINEIKTNPQNKQISIIVISKDGQESLVETAFELGADDYISNYNKLQELSLRINILARFSLLKTSGKNFYQEELKQA